MIRIAIRCDAGYALGSGHVMRMLTLAASLREQGAAITFICREHDGHLCDLVARHGHAVVRLPLRGAPADPCGPVHAAWLGAGWQDDADDTAAAIGPAGCDCVIIDHYGVDARWERRLRPLAHCIAVVDDLADRAHDCDILLDQNLVQDHEHRYDTLLAPDCVRLLGPRYALLQDAYAGLHATRRARGGRAANVLIFFGGADNDDLTGRAADAFLSLARPDVRADVVVAANGRHTPALRARLAGVASIRVHSGLPSLAPLMAQADVAIGGGGATSWERLCLGLPALIVTMADNQVPVARELHRRGWIHWLGASADVGVADIAAALAPFLDGTAAATGVEQAAGLVDGQGCPRTATAILQCIAREGVAP